MANFEELRKMLERFRPQEMTNFTSVIHNAEYPAISPTRPELSQAGRTILITGGSSGVGLATAKAFIRAGAATVFINGRRPQMLADAIKELQDFAVKAGQSTEIIGDALDVSDGAAVEKLWAGFADKGITVDVLVLNSATFADAKPLVELGVNELWRHFENNVRGPFDFAERFIKQPGDIPRFLINVSTAAINMLIPEQEPISASRPGYGLTKNAGTLTAQLIANGVSPDKVQVVSFHPGAIYAGGWKDAGVPRDILPFDDENLPAGFAVWAASPEARFLHGRFVWASWDIDELRTGDLKKRIDTDYNFLRIGIIGLDGGLKA